ncbi:hypothetical protein SAMN04489860_1193 [Paraoerskovia marina]|uniref:Uncharacterized protein n=1 Tax=Paraoerskovia marina TaxID=545619 RepID=A0A1H1QWN5_9CELL|nr:hypothetical protein [Paraoerskovia marina]SDS27770.1 hypothetical protein SAMN04489860_1193 [Paraoerskovia marina]
MKRYISAAVACLLALSVSAVAAPAANAVPSRIVTSSEFYSVHQGNSIAHVRARFGNNGTVTARYDTSGWKYDWVSLDFPTYYDSGWVTVDFVRNSSGTWVLDTKYAYWGLTAVQTKDKATKAEFNRVKEGNSIDYARSTFGTNGTIISYVDAPGYAYDLVTIEWPTASPYGYVLLDFGKRSSGSWKVETRSAYWG